MNTFDPALAGGSAVFPDFFRGFTASQKTIILVAAIITPGALYGAVTFQAVSIVDPNTGANSFVDIARRLYVYDPIAGYANNPANFVRISGNANGDGNFHSIYTVPGGKALILKSVTMSYYNGVAGNDNYIYFYDSANIGNSYVAGMDDVNLAGNSTVTLGNGWFLHSGDIIKYQSFNGNVSPGASQMATVFSLEGYLAPSGAVPAVASFEASQQMIRVGNFSKK